MEWMMRQPAGNARWFGASLRPDRNFPGTKALRRKSSRRRGRRFSVIAGLERLEERTLLSGASLAAVVAPKSSTLPALSPSQITALDTYVAAPDSSYQYSLNSVISGPGYTDYVVNMISQTWSPQPGVSEVWQHWLQVIVPSTVDSKTAVLNISGDSNTSSPPTSADSLSVETATTLGAIVTFIPTVPNEPVTFPSLGETTPLSEDALVAFSFQQYLNGDGQNWPILLPMVKSAVRAMDTTQSFVASESGGALSVDNFIVTGASKRGWTTWLTPAVDSRIIAIVPYVFDGLNLPDQVESQLDTYVNVTQDTANGDSTAVEPYTTTFDQLGTTQGQSLLSIIDPLDYVGRSTYDIPKYLVDSTGDQFFVPDAQFFFNDLPGENYLRYVPNTDHGLDLDAAVGGIEFEKALLDGAALPQFGWAVSNSGSEITLNSATTPSSVTMWQATNPTNRDFRLETFGANWTSSPLTDQGGGTYVATVTPPATGATDFFIQMQYAVDGMMLTFTTQISTVPLLQPAVTVSDAGGAFSGSPYAASATAIGPGGLPVPGSFTYTYYAGGTASGPALAGPPTDAGTYTVVANFATTDPDYVNGQSAPVTFAISPPELALYNGLFSGTYSGTNVVKTNGKSTSTTISATPFQSTINDGVIAVTASGITGSGAVDSQGNISGTVITQIDGTNVSVAITGKVTTANASGTTASGKWQYSANLGNGVVVSGHGTWSESAAQIVTDFDGSYAGSYKGSTVLKLNGKSPKTTVPATSFTAAISDGAIQSLYPTSSGLSPGTGTIGASGNVSGTTSFVANGVTVTVTYTGKATRSLSGVSASGTWSFSANLGGGETETGQGTWTVKRVLIFDGSYAGTFSGTITDNNHGTITTTTLPNSGFTDNSVQLAIASGVVTVSAPGVPATGTGTIDSNGNIAGTVSYVSNGVTVTVSFSGKAVQTTSGDVINGTWSYSVTYPNGVKETGSGVWNASGTTTI
jgi:PhoPQ-activated pathogenicity-related protein